MAYKKSDKTKKPLAVKKPATQKAEDTSSTASWDLSELDKRPDSKTTSAPRHGSETSKRPRPLPTTLGITITTAAPTIAKEAAETNEWNIPAFESEKKKVRKEVVR